LPHYKSKEKEREKLLKGEKQLLSFQETKKREKEVFRIISKYIIKVSLFYWFFSDMLLW